MDSVGTNVTGPGGDPNVALYVDGFYMPSQTGNMFDLPSLDRVEILKGPQGTLFGRNATGGAILLTTKDPSFNTKAFANASYGRFNEYRLGGYVTTGLSKTMAADLSASYRASDGWLTDLRTGENRNAQHSLDVRGKLLWEPAETVRLVFSASYNDTSDPTGLSQATLNANSVGRDFGELPQNIASGPRVVTQEFQTEVKVKAHQFGIRADFELPFATLTSLTGYRKEDAYIASDLDSSYARAQFAAYDQYFENYSQELTLTSDADGPLTWVTGLFLYKQTSGFERFLFNGFPFARSQVNAEALAVFADGTYRFGDLSIIAGLRYSTEERAFYRTTPGRSFPAPAKTTFSDLTPRLGLRYELTDNSNVYATYTQGFKSGTYNATAAITAPPVRPENITAYEVGYKSASANASLSIAGFYYKYTDIQVTAFDFNAGVSRLLNAASARSYGIEVDGQFQVTDALKLRAAAAWTNARFESFPGAPSFPPQPDLSGNNSVFVDASGGAMLRAPDFTVSGTVDYTLPIGDRSLNIVLRPYWTSEINFSFDERITQPAYFTLDADMHFKLNDNLEFSVWGRNLTDKVYATFRGQSTARDGIIFAQPLTFGVAIRASY
ncbi:MAG: TonB-dependent receptor [Polymorphobacter sp.]